MDLMPLSRTILVLLTGNKITRLIHSLNLYFQIKIVQ